MAETFNMNIDQGTTYTVSIIWTDAGGDPVNVAGYAARMEFRSPNTKDILDTFTDADSITVGGEDGAIDFVLTPAESRAYDWVNAVHDLIVTSDGGVVTRLFQGAVTIDPHTTQPAVP